MGSDWARLGLSTTTFQNEVTVVKGLWNRGEGKEVCPPGVALGSLQKTYC